MKAQNSIPPQKEKCEDSSLKRILRHLENEHIKYIMFMTNFIVLCISTISLENYSTKVKKKLYEIINF